MVGVSRSRVSGRCRRKLSVKNQSISLPEVPFPGLRDYVISQFDFQATQPGFDLFLFLEKGRPFGITNGFVSCGVNPRRKSLVSLGELNHLRVLGQFGLLLGR